MTDLTPFLADAGAVIAVVGASDHEWKYGSIIYRDMKARGYRVLAVNPNRQTVDGDPCYPNLASLPSEPAIVDMVVPPWEGKRVAEEAHRLGYRRIWLQPGSESPGLIEYLEESGFKYLAGACIMVRAGQASLRRRP
jgi:predicted CoA-binding protein